MAKQAGVCRRRVRDEIQHWFIVVVEDLLNLNMRVLVTIFELYLLRALELALVPARAAICIDYAARLF